MDLEREFVTTSRAYLTDEYGPKIRRCLALLDDEQIWWRPNEQVNSIGNLVLHLCGNIRQYVVSGVGGEDDVRRRDDEFAARGGQTRDDLDTLLSTTIEDVARALDRLDPTILQERRVIQGRERTVFHALYHAIEHFSMHTGQIIQLTKQLTGRDLDFYRFQDGNVQPNW